MQQAACHCSAHLAQPCVALVRAAGAQAGVIAGRQRGARPLQATKCTSRSALRLAGLIQRVPAPHPKSTSTHPHPPCTAQSRRWGCWPGRRIGCRRPLPTDTASAAGGACNVPDRRQLSSWRVCPVYCSSSLFKYPMSNVKQVGSIRFPLSACADQRYQLYPPPPHLADPRRRPDTDALADAVAAGVARPAERCADAAQAGAGGRVADAHVGAGLAYAAAHLQKDSTGCHSEPITMPEIHAGRARSRMRHIAHVHSSESEPRHL